jgi:hypothetical protein
MLAPLRIRGFFLACAVAITVLLFGLARLSGRLDSLEVIKHALHPSDQIPTPPQEETPPEQPQPERERPIYKPPKEERPPITDNFPLAAQARSSRDLPSVPQWNQPPSPHVAEKTPLFIGFTRNWLLLQQAVVSYITAGWPPEDIYVVENTGVMNANRDGKLSLQNPFYLNYRRLKDVLGVNVISTPTLLSFAQLQNFYFNTALEKKWDYFFWSHMVRISLDCCFSNVYCKSYGSLTFCAGRHCHIRRRLHR